MAFFNNAQSPYAAGPNAASQPLQFFGGQSSSGPGYSAYDASGGVGSAGGYGSAAASGNMNMQSRIPLSEGKWWEAFGTGGFEGEPGLMEGRSFILSVWLYTAVRLRHIHPMYMVFRNWRKPFAYLGQVSHRAQSFTKGRRTHHG